MECNKKEERYTVEDLLAIMQRLRNPGGCPWDREQTHRSIRQNVIEEAYETAEAIDLDNDEMLCEELGDLLLQVVFHARIAQEADAFDFTDVCDGICRKLIHRHPHIFGDVKADTAEQVLDNWARIKKEEKGQQNTAEVMDGVAKSLPALMRGQKIAKAAVKGGLQPAAQPAQDPEAQVNALLWEAVRQAAAAKIDAEEVFTRYLNGIIEQSRRTQ